MEKKILYMIGNSHIDPVWFWDWDEGMQEVKATFSSALERLTEYPEMTFTATSTAFLEWLEYIAPSMFEEIKKRVAEGRFLLTGGWFIEPDCILPCGESFVRQGLYGQSYLQEHFGKLCRTASNVDSFGHAASLPQILRKSGMKEYVFMRPRLDTPVFKWKSADGSQIDALSLPSEYTTWFHETIKEATDMAEAAAQKAGLHGMPCCFGVGNHGGGPTKKNIEAVYRLRQEKETVNLVFAGYDQFFDALSQEERNRLPVREEFFDGINTGCYSMDGVLKYRHRLAEKRLLMTEWMLAMEKELTGNSYADSKEMKRLWKIVLFNQFHDTLGGTAIKAAREEAVMQLQEVAAACKRIWSIAIQNIVNCLSTAGEGFPLFLFQASGEEYDDYVEVEVNWFCKDGLILCNELGEEISYQRSYTDAKVRNYNLGGRRRIVFRAKIPAGGFVMYRLKVGDPELACDIRKEPEFPLWKNNGYLPEDDPYCLENDYIRVRFSERGYLSSIYDKIGKYEVLSAEVFYPIWKDERDTWGNLQGREFGDSGLRLEAEKLELVESGNIRKVVRATYRHGGSRLIQVYILYRESKKLEIRNELFWDKPWHMLKIAYPLREIESIASQMAYGTYFHKPEKEKEYSMHRFVDALDKEGHGLYVSNNGKYTYHVTGGILSFPIARSAIFSQGNGKNWYNPVEGYSYSDLGEQEFIFCLMPHGRKITQSERYLAVEGAEKRYLSLVDNIHGGKSLTSFSPIDINPKNIKIVAVKEAEQGEALILRLLEVEGESAEVKFVIEENEFSFPVKPWEILTLKIDQKKNSCEKTDLLERTLDRNRK